MNYLARSSYLLQQGHFGADVVYFYGEDSNLTAIFDEKAPDMPAGYGFDYINADGLIHELSVENGRITTQERHELSRAWARSVQPAHVAAGAASRSTSWWRTGAIVAGPKPTDDPSLADDQAEFHRLSDGACSATARACTRWAKARSTRARAWRTSSRP